MAWNVITVRPRFETVAANRLASLGLVTFLPMCAGTIRRGRSRARCSTATPFFRGYLFVVVDDRLWKALHEVSVLNGFLRRADGGPAVLSDEAIQCVKAMAEMQNSTPTRQWPFQPGDKVKVAGDRNAPFYGLTAILLRLDRRDKAVLESMVNSRVRLTVNASRLELAE